MDHIPNHPLFWPADWPRVADLDREGGRFRGTTVRASALGSYRDRRELSISEGVDRALTELGRLGAVDVIISSNVKARLDGLPYSNQPTPLDPGVAVWFKLNRQPRVIACDRFLRVANNLAAIAATIAALRAIDRHGAARADRVFAGFAALPMRTGKPWRAVLGIKPDAEVDREDVQRRYRELAARHHPDAGGTHEAMSEINRARDEAIREVS